jgi:sarcosine oxidase
MERYEAIVVGVGGVGSAALYELARRGVRALGIDRFNPPHDRGSTHGHTRVIRQAYFEHSDYVPLLRESYKLWGELESATNSRLFHQVGLIEIGPADGVVVPGVLRAADEHGLAVEPLTSQQVQGRWPGIRFEGDLVGVFEPAAGYLLVEDCVRAHIDAARAAGAELLTHAEVTDVSTIERGVDIRTIDGRVYRADQVILAEGAWSAQMLTPMGIACEIRRKSLFWFAADRAEYNVANGMPVFLFELPAGVFYGFPKLDERGVKFAEHSGGRMVDDPLTVDRSIDQHERQRLVDVLADHLPGVSAIVNDHAVCLYTMSPDEHFILDRHPTLPNVVFAAGLSGHGFKFTPVLGRALADLALDGGTDLPIEFLSLDRFK